MPRGHKFTLMVTEKIEDMVSNEREGKEGEGHDDILVMVIVMMVVL